MKILVINLLRLGDVLMTAPLLGDLKKKYPDSSIHLLINTQFRHSASILGHVDRFHFFDRQGIQESLGDPEKSLFHAHDRISDLVDELGNEGFDLLLNLTQNRLSAWLASLIPARQYLGLVFDQDGRAQFGSVWFRQLNQQIDYEESDGLHIIDIFRHSLGSYWKRALDWGIKETADGKIASSTVFPGQTGIVAIQVLTSDEKKNWGLDRFRELILTLQQRHPSLSIALLCSPDEMLIVQSAFGDVISSRVQICDLSLAGLVSFFKRCRLVVSGDTSIKHLAASMQVLCLELALGPSDIRLTGVYQHGSIIMRSKESCVPCVHSKPCHRERRYCADSIPAAVVGMVASQLLSHMPHQLQTIADEYSDQLEILRVDTQSTGFFLPIPLSHEITEVHLAPILSKILRRLVLSEEAHAQDLDFQMGSIIHDVGNMLRASYSTSGPNDWKYFFADFERQIGIVDARMNGIRLGIKMLTGQMDSQKRVREFVKGLRLVRERMQHARLLWPMRSNIDGVIEDDISAPFVRVRRIVDTIRQLELYIRFANKMMRGLGGEFGQDRQTENRGRS